MYVEAAQPLLTKALQQLAAIPNAKSTLPLLAGIKLRAASAGLFLTAANTGMMLQYIIPSNEDRVTIQQFGSIVVPAHYFSEIIRHSPQGPITLECTEDLQLVIKTGKAVYQLSGMSAEHFPSIAEINSTPATHVSNTHLKEMIKRVSFAAAASESRPVLTGVACTLADYQITMTATDGIRLATCSAQAESNTRSATALSVIPGKHLSIFSKMITDEHGTTAISVQQRTVQMSTSNIIMQSSVIEGSFPTTDRLIPAAFASDMILDSSILLHALKRVSLLSGDNNIVKLSSLIDGTITLSSRASEVGDAIEELDIIEHSGELISLYFKGKYMIEIMEAVSGRKIALRMSNIWSPIIIQLIDDSSALYILSPIRARD